VIGADPLFRHAESLLGEPVVDFPRFTAQSMSSARGVVIATINRPHGDTGVHTHTAMLHRGLSDIGINSRVVTPFGGGAKWLPLFAIRRLLLSHVNKTWSTRWYRHWNGLALREQLRKHLANRQVSQVIAQCPISAAAALAARRALGRDGDLKINLVCHFNHSEALEYRNRGELNTRRAFEAAMVFETSVLSSVDRVIYVSNWARNLIEKDRGIAVRSSLVIPNGIDSATAPSPLHRADLDLTDDQRVLITVGTLERRKNQLGLLDVFARIIKDNPKARLVLVGDGPDRPAIEARIAELSLGPAVRLLGHRTDVAALLPLADVYVHYATAENCPMAILEAARAGLPAASVPAGGVRELQEQLQSHLSLNPDDPSGSAAAIGALLNDPDRRLAMGHAARRCFLQVFTRNTMIQSYAAGLDLLTLSSEDRAA
jgi:glycosyltransferase involved in cell wall biosynthesis